MRVIDFLDKSGVNYELTTHNPAFTAQGMAAKEHEPGRFVAKPVIVKADDQYVMCVLAAHQKIDLSDLKNQLGAKSLDLAQESDMADIFDDCQLGAEPPFGNLYDLTTVIDQALTTADHIMFQAGTHQKAVKMTMKDYLSLVEPKVLKFSSHVMP